MDISSHTEKKYTKKVRKEKCASSENAGLWKRFVHEKTSRASCAMRADTCPFS